jgi:hypothetical protein
MIVCPLHWFFLLHRKKPIVDIFLALFETLGSAGVFSWPLRSAATWICTELFHAQLSEQPIRSFIILSLETYSSFWFWKLFCRRRILQLRTDHVPDWFDSKPSWVPNVAHEVILEKQPNETIRSIIKLPNTSISVLCTACAQHVHDLPNFTFVFILTLEHLNL